MRYVDMNTDIVDMKPELETEVHPFGAWVPDGAKVLIMGTFPPQPKRWSMEFFYPNRTNDFWYAMGLLFYGDRNALLLPGSKDFDLEKIKALLNREGIALSDTGYRIRRLAGNASDKFLEIVEPVDLDSLLRRMPQCRAIATTGQKAAEVLAELTGTEAPAMGHYMECAPRPLGDGRETLPLEIWRMPSTSRAYPLPLAKKAEYYRALFKSVGIGVVN
jgi:hypothetical protein